MLTGRINQSILPIILHNIARVHQISMEICIFYWLCTVGSVCATVHHNLWLLIQRSTENCQSFWNGKKTAKNNSYQGSNLHKYHWNELVGIYFLLRMKWFSSFVWGRNLNSTLSYHSTLIFNLNCFIFYSNVFIYDAAQFQFIQLKSKRLAASVDLIWLSSRAIIISIAKYVFNFLNSIALNFDLLLEA